MTKDERIKKFRKFMPVSTRIDINDLLDLGFFTRPASTKYHGAYEGGLFDHSFLVAENLVNLTQKLDLRWERPESPYIVGMYHDLCKCDDYVKDPETDKWVYNPMRFIPGHGEKSVMLLQEYKKLTTEEIACICWHMGAFEADPKKWTYYGNAIEYYPNVLYTHTADMIASRILGV